MFYLLFIIGWLLGLVVAALTLVQASIVIFFGFPLTRKLNKQGDLISPNPIQRGNLISLITWIVIYIAALYIVYLWSGGVLTGFLVGTAMIILLSLGKLGTNQRNLKNYLESNERFLRENKSGMDDQKPVGHTSPIDSGFKEKT